MSQPKKGQYDDLFKKMEAAGDATEISVDHHTWEKDGETIVGRLIDVSDSKSGDEGGKFRIFTVDRGSDRISFTGGAVLSQLMGDGSLLGKVVAVRYLGKRDLGKGRRVNDFKVWQLPETEE